MDAETNLAIAMAVPETELVSVQSIFWLQERNNKFVIFQIVNDILASLIFFIMKKVIRLGCIVLS